MTIITPTGITGITSITSIGNTLQFHNASGADVSVSGLNVTSGTNINVSGIVTASGGFSGGNGTFSSQIQSTQANSTTTGGGQIYLNGATGNRIDFNTNGVAAPTFTTRSAGTKIVLYPNIGASQVDFAIGIENATLWSSVADSSQQFKWYAGTTNIATLNGNGNFGIGESNPASKLTVRSDSAAGRGGEISIINYATSTVGNEAALNFGLENSTYAVDDSNVQIKARLTNSSNGAADLIFSTWNGSAFGEKGRITSQGNSQFGPGAIGISNLSWGTDTYQVPHIFCGKTGGAPADGPIVSATTVTNPSAQRIGGFIFASPVTGTSVTTNPSLKGGIDCTTNTNVANAADTGAYLNFYTKVDNGSFRNQMTLNSNGVLTKPYQPAFLAYRNSTLAVSATWQLISNGILTESYDIGSVYSTATNGRFVAPVAGRYMFYAGGWSVGNTNGERYAFGVKVNNSGSPDFLTGGNYCITDTPLVPYQIVLNLSANDYVELFYFSAINTSIGGGTHYIYWGGYLLG